ncbi:hypothetical protein D6B98_38305 [Bradyrhizobium sp. LVM 105]|nr:hypothetical protein D6B98_38305 [Bradyrhizobium sp. LVM 105]
MRCAASVVVSRNSGAQQRKHHQIEGGIEFAAFERGFTKLPRADRVVQIPQQEARTAYRAMASS